MDDLSFKSLEMRESIEKLAEDCGVERHVVRRVLREDEGRFYKRDDIRKTWFRRIISDKEEFEKKRQKVLSAKTKVLKILLRIAQGREDFSASINDSAFFQQAGIHPDSMKDIRKFLPEIGWIAISKIGRGHFTTYQWRSSQLRLEWVCSKLETPCPEEIALFKAMKIEDPLLKDFIEAISNPQKLRYLSAIKQISDTKIQNEAFGYLLQCKEDSILEDIMGSFCPNFEDSLNENRDKTIIKPGLNNNKTGIKHKENRDRPSQNLLKNNVNNTQSVRAFSLKSGRAHSARALSPLEEGAQRRGAEEDEKLCKKYENAYPGYPAYMIRDILKTKAGL